MAAEKDGNIRAVPDIKMYDPAATDNDCRLLEKLPGRRVLPPLSKEYDREYCIDADPVSRQDLLLLYRSGYRISHRPYFAMMGRTTHQYTLNPHTKEGADATWTDRDSISFAEFLNLFANGRGV